MIGSERAVDMEGVVVIVRRGRGICCDDIWALVISWFICSNSAESGVRELDISSISMAPVEILFSAGDISSSSSSISAPASETASITGAKCCTEMEGRINVINNKEPKFIKIVQFKTHLLK